MNRDWHAHIEGKLRSGSPLSGADAKALLEDDRLGPQAFLPPATRMPRFAIGGVVDLGRSCWVRCLTCPAQPDGPVIEHDCMLDKVDALVSAGASVVELRGSLTVALDLESWIKRIASLRKRTPDLEIRALTAVEIAHLSEGSEMSSRQVLEALRAVGLVASPLPGHEQLATEARHRVAPHNVGPAEYARVTSAAAELGLRARAGVQVSSETTPRERVEHLEHLRELQFSERRFEAVEVWRPRKTRSGSDLASEIELLRTVAVARLFLGESLPVSVPSQDEGADVALRALAWGATDLGIVHPTEADRVRGQVGL